MLQKFALALKTKTVEFFAEEEEEDEEAALNGNDIDSAEEIITGQRVVVLKPDNPNKVANSSPPPQLQHALVSSLFATVSSFHASYLHLQTAHEPFQRDNIEAADRMAVSQLQRFSDIRRSYCDMLKDPGLNPSLPLSSHLEAQVQENQSMLRKFETVFNRLQSDIDQKDLEVSALKQQLREIEVSNKKLVQRLDGWVSSACDQEDQVLLSVGSFDSLLKEACSMAHSFSKNLIDLMKKSGWDLHSASNSIYPNVDYAKRGHYLYAILSYICLAMFGEFGSGSFGLEDGTGSTANDLSSQRKDFLRQFVDHLSADPLELLSTEPECEFAKFCEKKYRQLIRPELESSLTGKFDGVDSVLRSLRHLSSLYEPFVNMASSIWLLHKLALAFNQGVEIFQVGRGAEFSMIYMESVVRSSKLTCSDCREARPKVGFTVFPGFLVGSTVIQCRVYLNCMR